jgi:hypothetical protein
MAVVLVPSPPRTAHRGAVSVPKGVSISKTAVNMLLREENSARKSLTEVEDSARRDVQFLIAVGRSEFRKLDTSPERKRGVKGLDLVLFDSTPSPRPVKKVLECRPEVIHSRRAPARLVEVQREEEELRSWLVRLEAKMMDGIFRHAQSDFAFVTRIPRCIALEASARAAETEAEHSEWKGLMKSEFLEKPPFNRPPTPPRNLSVEEQADEEYRTIMQDEASARRECHDWLVLRYGVLLFSVNRVEDIYRQEIEEAFENSFARAVFDFHHVMYRASMCALCAFHASPSRTPLLVGTALTTILQGR